MRAKKIQGQKGGTMDKLKVPTGEELLRDGFELLANHSVVSERMLSRGEETRDEYYKVADSRAAWRQRFNLLRAQGGSNEELKELATDIDRAAVNLQEEFRKQILISAQTC